MDLSDYTRCRHCSGIKHVDRECGCQKSSREPAGYGAWIRVENKLPEPHERECGYCDRSGYISKPVKTEQDWSEELSDLQRDALRYRHCLHEINYAITVTNAGEDRDLPGITSAEMLERCFELLNGERDEIFD